MIEDIQAQAHLIIDTLTFDNGTVALSALRTLSDSNNKFGPFSRLLGFHVQEIGSGTCVATLEVKEHHLNALNIAHGGVTYSLADSACGLAAFSVLGRTGMVTQDMQIRYHGPVKVGEISASAKVIHHGQRTITIQCHVTQNQLLMASCSATFAILSQQELDVVKGGHSGNVAARKENT